MISKKLALISGLMITSLSLSGCSSLESMINNKIASTAKDVSNSVNSEVAKTTDALKNEFGVVDGEVYANKEFGFSLQFPKSWGKVAAKGPTVKKLVSNNAKEIEVSSEDKSKTYTIIIVDNKIAEDDGLERNALLGKTAKYNIFGEVYDTSAFEGGFVNKEVKAINESFKVL